MDSLIKHYPAPDCYPDRRGLVLTMCGRRVNEKTEIEYHEELTCESCQTLKDRWLKQEVE